MRWYQEKVNTKKLTKAKFAQLMNQVTGHSKSFVEKNTRIEGANVFKFAVGEFQYMSWVKDRDYIYTMVALNGCVVLSFYHNFDTLVNDFDKDEEYRNIIKQEWLDSRDE
ncbi:MAG: hypothetical protein H9W82_12150 [Lactobacillus sp.]|nr:hypothetical protein [Lactobacillus sp.]